MPTRRALIASLTLALFAAGIGSAGAAEKLSLTAREIRYDAQCPLPRDVPCAIKKPVISGYRVLTESISLDDQGSYWIADLSTARQQQGKNEPIRVLSDNGVWHIISVKYTSGAAARTASEKSGDGVGATGKAPGASDPAAPKKKAKADPKPESKPKPKPKEAAKPDGKASPELESCYERCRNTP